MKIKDIERRIKILEREIEYWTRVSNSREPKLKEYREELKAILEGDLKRLKGKYV